MQWDNLGRPRGNSTGDAATASPCVADRVAMRRPASPFRIAMLRTFFRQKSAWAHHFGKSMDSFFSIVFEFKFRFFFAFSRGIIWIPFPWTNIHRTPVQSRSFWLQPGAVNSPEKFIATSPFSRYNHINGLVFLRKSSPETHGFLPSNIGVSGENFPSSNSLTIDLLLLY